MLLEGSCHCGSVKFRVESSTPYPYQACYCSICRKTAGGGGYVINLGADADTLEVEGGENVSVYSAKSQDRGAPERNFCKHCGGFLWLFNPMWPELIHPFASAIDTPLPKP
ncbi:MAG: GFA family protein, partial [Actinomycetota bacterium]|nr:GFA family protein [Actinomycetota bacterium]